eukprot:g14564.t1
MGLDFWIFVFTRHAHPVRPRFCVSKVHRASAVLRFFGMVEDKIHASLQSVQQTQVESLLDALERGRDFVEEDRLDLLLEKLDSAGQLSSVPRVIRGGGKSKEAVEVDVDTDFEANRSTRPPDGLSLFPPTTTDFGANLARELRYQGFHRSPSAAILPESHTRSPPPAVDAQTVNQMVRDNTHAFRSKLQARTHGRRVRARKEKAGSYDVLKRDLMELRAQKAREGVAMRELLLDCARMFDIRGGGEMLGDNGIETTQLQTYTLDGSSMPGSEFSVVGEGEENISGGATSGLAATGQKHAHTGYFPKARVLRPNARHAPDMRPKIPRNLFTFPLHVTHKPASHGLQKQLIPKPFFHFCDTSRPTPHSFEPFLSGMTSGAAKLCAEEELFQSWGTFTSTTGSQAETLALAVALMHQQ